MLELIPPRLALFIIGLGLLYSGYWGTDWAWKEPGRYANALGDEGVTVEARIWNAWESYSTNSEGDSTLVRSVTVQYDYAGEEHEVDLVASGTPFAEAQEDEVIPLRLHPQDPEFLVHPEADRPSVFWRSIPIVLAFLLGGLIILGVLISLF